MAGELKRCNMASHPRTAKRKAVSSEECTTRKKVEVAASEREQAHSAPKKKMTRLPLEEVSRILTRAADDCAPYYFKSMKRQDSSLLPLLEEEEDASTTLLYHAARAHYTPVESIARFQAFVRGEFEKRGYLEVDKDFLTRRAQVRAWNDAAKARALKGLAVSD
jgi:hypothetical protein